MRTVRAVTVNACTRRGRGGSPTTVVLDAPWLSDDQRAQIARDAGTSHTAFVASDDSEIVDVRFLTRDRELTSCGHGTIAAHAALGRPGRRRQRTGGRTFTVATTVVGDELAVSFDQGTVELSPAPHGVCRAIVDALGLSADDVDHTRPAAIASPGAPRLLLPVTTPALARLRPHLPRLEHATRSAGLLGCFAYAPLAGERRYGARMFAPAIGVDEDIANANSSGSLAALISAATGAPAGITVDQGDYLRAPSTTVAHAEPTPRGIATRLSARATIHAVDDLAIA